MVFSPHLPSGDIKAEHKLMITCGIEDVVAFVAVRVTSVVDISHHGGFEHSATIGESAELKEGIQGAIRQWFWGYFMRVVCWKSRYNRPVSRHFPPSGEQPEHRKLAHEL